MKKDFLTITPENGNGSATVNVTADPNQKFQSRETTLNFSSTGGNNSVRAVQDGMPFHTFYSMGVSNTNQFVPDLYFKSISNGIPLIAGTISISSSTGNTALVMQLKLIILKNLSTGKTISIQKDDGSAVNFEADTQSDSSVTGEYNSYTVTLSDIPSLSPTRRMKGAIKIGDTVIENFDFPYRVS